MYVTTLCSVSRGKGMRKARRQAVARLTGVSFARQPDGYVYAWEHDRLWRKSRQPVGRKSSQARSSSSDDDDDDDDDISPTSSTEDEHEECLGIDLNRNWGYQFRPGTRPNPCSDSYPGAKAFESVELQALRDYMLDGVDAFLDVHSFGQMRECFFFFLCQLPCREDLNTGEAANGYPFNQQSSSLTRTRATSSPPIKRTTTKQFSRLPKRCGTCTVGCLRRAACAKSA